jgi:hypothetical protein
MKKIKWTVSWVTLKDKEARIDIYEEGYTGDTIELEASDKPFSTTEDGADDLMKEVRTQSGYIRVIDDGTLTDDIIPTTATAHPVIMTVDGEVTWQGYMKPDAYSADWDTNVEVELPVVSGLAVLESIYMDQTRDMVTTTLGSLLREAIEATGCTYSHIMLPYEVGQKSTDTARRAPLEVSVSRFTFFGESDMDPDDEDYEPYTAITYLEFIEEFCRLWGWSLMERGDTLYFVSPDAGLYDDYTLASLTGTTVNGPRVSTEAVELSTLHMDGSDHKRDVRQGVKKITVTASLGKVEEAVPAVDKTELGFIKRNNDNLQGETKYKMAMKWYGDGGENKSAQFIRYKKTDDGWVPNTTSDWNCVGGSYREYDLWLKKDEDKINFSFTGGIWLQMTDTGTDGYSPTEEEAEKMPVAIIRGMKAVCFNSGAFCISAKTYGENIYEGSVTVNNGYDTIHLSFRVGNKWWNGTAWQDTEAKFEVKTGYEKYENSAPGSLENTKTLDMPYNGAEGYMMIVDEPLDGIPILTIYANGNRSAKLGVNYAILLGDLKVTYYPTDEISDDSEDDNGENTYKAVIGGYEEEKEVELKMGTKKHNGACYGALSYEGADVTELYFSGEARLMRPEEALLTRLRRLYGRTTKALTLEIVHGDLTPLTRVTYDGTSYAVTGENVDWDTETETVTLTEN